MRLIENVSPQSMKACEPIPSWKHFSYQNVKAGNIFNITLYCCLSLTFSVTVTNGFEAVWIWLVSSLTPSVLSDVAARFGLCFQLVVNQIWAINVLITVFFQYHCPDTSYCFQRACPQDVAPSSAVSSLSLSFLDASLAPWPNTEGSFLLLC